MKQKRPSPVDALVGQRIRIERTARKMSQTALGEKIGVTFQQVQKYEKGTNRVGAGRLNQIAAVLDVPVSTFFDGAGGPSAKSHKHLEDSPVKLLTEAGAIRLLQAYSKLRGRNTRKAFVELLENAATKNNK